MKTEITRSTWEDVVFESRNKEYGAYSIRKLYHENVSKASVIAFSLAAFVFGVFQITSLFHIKIEIVSSTKKGTEIFLPPIIIPDPPAAEPEIKSLKKPDPNFFPIATRQEPVETPPIETPNTSPLDNGTVTIEGSTPGVDQGGVVESHTASTKPIQIYNGAGVMPQYEGGLKAMSRFLSKNIHYPTGERLLGHEGTVYVRFVVNEAGQVVDVAVIKGVSAMLDREAMRVVALMTKWKPGFQHDMPVNVRMVLPIRFELGDE